MHGKEDGPEFNAILGIAFLTAINVTSIPGLLELFFGIRVIQTPEAIPTWSIVIFMILFLCLDLRSSFWMQYPVCIWKRSVRELVFL